MRLEKISDPKQYFARVEWLPKKILGAQRQSATLDVRGVIAGDHDHRYRMPGAVRDDFFQNLEPVLAGHVKIEQDEVGLEFLVKRQRIFGIRCRCNLAISRFREDSLQQSNILGVVVDNEYPAGQSAGRCFWRAHLLGGSGRGLVEHRFYRRSK